MARNESAKNCHYFLKWLSALTHFSFTDNSQVVIPGCIAHSELSPAVCHNNVLWSPGKQWAGWLWNGFSCEFVSVCLLFLLSVATCLLCGKRNNGVWNANVGTVSQSSAIRGLTYHKPLVLKLVYWSSSEHGWEVTDACYSDLSDDKHYNCSYRWRSYAGSGHTYLSGMQMCVDAVGSKSLRPHWRGFKNL